ncbi:MAG: symporter small accessory protein [Thermochromatium sp.]
MLGLDDPFVLAAYLGIIALAAVSILLDFRRNAARDEITEEDRQWALEEKRVEDELQ